MNDKLKNLKSWFDIYVKSFDCDDPYINYNIKLKYEHTYKVCEEMNYLTKELALRKEQCRLAETIALLHDVGRFEQVKKFRTFNDTISVNHAELGLEIISKKNLLNGFCERDQNIVKIAIKNHNAKEILLPVESENCLLFAQLIRDADKIDIYRIILDAYETYTEKSGDFKLAISFQDSDGDGQCSPEVVNCVIKRQNIAYSSLKTFNDRKLLQLAWLYDINFVPSLKKIIQNGYVKVIYKHLPNTPEMTQVREVIDQYIAEKLAG